jgi:type IV secretory pathway VirB6-like protein
MEATARALALPSPCQQDNQCGMLTYLEPTACPFQTYQVYSTISVSAAAASAAASQQVTLAQHAIALNPNPKQPCPLSPVPAPPIPVCLANACQAANR